MLMATALAVGLYRVDATGPLWPDAPRYANAGAMMRDWLASGRLTNPYRFAQRNYAQYPAFSVPFHPPGYPGLTALVFVATGTSYLAARIVVAVCLGGAACAFHAIQRRFGVGARTALATALLLILTPEIARWGRDTMSEIPALAVILAASYLFLRWLDSGRPRDCWAALGTATLAFLCRVTTIGNLPGWFLFAVWTGRGRRLKSPHLIAAMIFYGAVAVGQVKLAARFSRYEVVSDGKGDGLTRVNLAYFSHCLPEILTWGTSLAGLAGLVCAVGFGRRTPAGRFWLSWLLGYTVFKLLVATTFETRHFLGALPAFAGLAACLFGDVVPVWTARGVGPPIIALGVLLNLHFLAALPRGVVGYQDVAAGLAARVRSGNVLLACPQDQELIFRYRARVPGSKRVFVRSDRTLAVRLAEYARVAPRILARRPEDVLEAVRRGRIRYLVTSEPLDSTRDSRYEEMVLAHQTAVSRPDLFAPSGRYPLLVQFGGAGARYRVWIWTYLGALPDGPGELPVVIPTARLILKPS